MIIKGIEYMHNEWLSYSSQEVLSKIKWAYAGAKWPLGKLYKEGEEKNAFQIIFLCSNKVLERFLRDFTPYLHDSITPLSQICCLHVHDGSLLFHHTPKVL